MRALLPFLLLSTIGCTGLLELQLQGVNSPPEYGRKEIPSPTFRIYLLKDRVLFEEASVVDLWTRHREVLKEDLLSFKECSVDLRTGEFRKVPLGEDSANIRYIGVFALLPKEDPEGTRRLVLTKSDLSRVVRVTWTRIELEK